MKTMPQKRAAQKELRKGKKRHARNTAIVSEIKTLTKKFNLLLAEKKFDQAKEALKAASSGFNKAATKGVIHKNTASRKISRLSKKLHKASK
jgi:small subunit ribosomal protein S20